MLECYVYSVLTYGCETWTLSKPLIDRLEACEMWFLRKMGRINKQIKTNEEVLALFETERKLINKIKNRKMSFFWPRQETRLRHKTNSRGENEWQTRQKQTDSVMG